MKALVHGLVRIRVKAYYLPVCLTWGLDHFRTTVGEGLEIMEPSGATSGLPSTYVIDVPGGGGRSQISPNILTIGEGSVLRNYEESSYIQASTATEIRRGGSMQGSAGGTHRGGRGLASTAGERSSLIPESTDRFEKAELAMGARGEIQAAWTWRNW